MQFVRCERLATYCIGQAASMGAVLLAGGAATNGFLLTNSRVLLHQPHVMGVLEGPATDLDIEAREILRLRERLDQILAHHSGQNSSKIQKDTDRNLWLSAEESVSYGLADQILQKAPEIVRADDKE
jgi:ATP-dependent Clp protease protease subunit